MPTRLTRARQLRSIARTLERLEDRHVLESTVVFNEVMYNPLGDDSLGAGEWIEFHNQRVVDIDISDWLLRGGVDYKFPDQTIVPGHGYLIVAADPVRFKTATGRDALGPWSGTLDNQGESLELMNNDNRQMNALDYSDEGDWPEAADGGGVSLAKTLGRLASAPAENWTWSAQVGGTPGAMNFIPTNTEIATTLLTSGAPVRATVPANDGLGTQWTQASFIDTAWVSGRSAVGYATSATNTFDALIGLDVDAPPNGQTPIPMQNNNTSVYIRAPFQASSDDLQSSSLTLRMRYDDGFVAYLNGVEVASANAPGRNGDPTTLAWNSSALRSNSNTRAVKFEDFDISNFRQHLVAGTNVLAIHGLNFSLTDSDTLFDAEIVARRTPQTAAASPIRLNEVAGTDSLAFFIELRNTSNEPVNLEGYRLRTDDPAAPVYTFPSLTLAGGQVTTVTRNQFPIAVTSEPLVLLQTPNQQIIDGLRVEERTRGRATELAGDWGYPLIDSAGAPNVFRIQQDIVINEVNYSPPPELTVADIPPQYDRTVVLGMTSQVWRYNAAGSLLPSTWYQQDYAADGQTWKQGNGLIGYDVANLGVPINTQVTQPSLNDPRFLTYYFQTDFQLTAEQFANTDVLELTHFIDSGAVFYLNGERVHGFNMPSGTIDATTPATISVPDAQRSGPYVLPQTMLRVGKNTLSAEVHLRSSSASDVVFGAELIRGQKTSELIPGSPYRERDELEWIELYNKGTTAVDLSNWTITHAVDYKIPQGTVLNPSQYLVIAKDTQAFAAAYPGVPAIGNFAGTLGNHDEEIRLIDRQGNRADQVHYYEGNPWPAMADGGGSTLELRDPTADNNQGAAWAASDESDQGEWITHTFRGTSQRDVYMASALFHEFVFGLLDAGEFLLDDVVVIKDPAGAKISVMQNGTFENDAIGAAPAKWRLIGNHSGVVVNDPDHANNKVLKVTATGAQAHVHDHAETTFANAEKIVDGTEFTISFRAKWLSGNGQLTSRLWFNRLSNTVRLDVPVAVGTPGRANSARIDNAGPTYTEFGHSPTTPRPSETVTVTAKPYDAQGIASMTLFWRLDGANWNSSAMTADASGVYRGTIPPQAAGKVVQFYVRGIDNLGAVSTYPDKGVDSRALYQVEDGVGPVTPINRARLVIMKSETDRLFADVNRMSNWTLPMTLIYNDVAIYDAAVRQTGSRWIRPNSGYKVDLPPAQAIYGIHDSVRFDINGMAELVMKQMLNRAGGNSASTFDDVGFLVSPRSGHSHEILVQLERYENNFLNEQFENGSDGTKWELDDVVVPIGPVGGVEGLKAGTEVYQNADIGVNTTMVLQQGGNPEFYRGHLLIKSNRYLDNYQAIADLAEAIHKTGEDLFAATNEVMDVDLWMRHYANQSYFGNWDTYGFGRPKNLRIYQRPSDGKIIPLFWDCDLCNFTEAIKKVNEPTSRLDEIRDIPHNLRLYWGHMHDLMNRSFKESYVSRWATHYGELLNFQTHGGDETFTSIAGSTRARTTQAMAAILRDIPQVDFQITTNGGEATTVDTNTIRLEGKGWVNVRQIRFAGDTQPLDAFWPTRDGWRIDIPLAFGQQTLKLEAYDYEGKLIATDSIDVTSTAIDPAYANLRLTEIQYHPGDPSASEVAAGFSDADEFEYLEFTNVGTQAISLDRVRLERQTVGNVENGVEFDFSQGTVHELLPGQSVVVVENLAAFRARYGQLVSVAGAWIGGLSNSNEKLTVTVNQISLHSFTYQDNWVPSTDGTGRSLEVVDAKASDLGIWGTAAQWRASEAAQGSPGTHGLGRILGDANGDGLFNSSDLVRVFQAGEYEDTIEDNSTFEEGDWNADGDFTTADLVAAFAAGTYQLGADPLAALAIAQRSDLSDDEQPIDDDGALLLLEGPARRARMPQIDLVASRVDALFAQVPTSRKTSTSAVDAADDESEEI